MACECLTTINAKMAEHNTRIMTMFCTDPSFERGWYNTVMIEVEKVDRRKRDRIRIAPTFCPFCGVRYVPKSLPTPGAAP